MTEHELPIPMARHAVFNQLLGMFHQNWSAIDLFTDYAIFKFLKITPEQGHLITSGMMFGRKARLLFDLIKHSDFPAKGRLLESFGKIRAIKRDAITHSYVRSDMMTVTFMERSISGAFTAKEHTFTFEEFRAVCLAAVNAVDEFMDALGATQADIDAFANAAFNLNRKSTKSPDAPTSSK